MLAPTIDDLIPKHPGGRPSREELGIWAIEHTECVRCGESKRRHKAKGFCIRCYNALAKQKERA